MKIKRSFLQQYPLLSFVLLTYAITWLLWTPSLLSARGWLPVTLPDWASLPGNFGPVLAAVLLLARNEGKNGVRKLLAGLVRWRIPLRWYLLALGLPLLMNTALIALFGVLSGLTPDLGLGTLLTLLSAFLYWTVVGGPLGEEPGWRGYLLPRLQSRYSALSASLVVAAVWFAWHLPRYLDPNILGGSGITVLVFGLQIVAYTILHTWVYNNSTGSLLLVVLFHAAINSITYTIPILYPAIQPADVAAFTTPVLIAMLGFILIWALLVVIRGKPANLSQSGRVTQPEESESDLPGTAVKRYAHTPSPGD